MKVLEQKIIEMQVIWGEYKGQSTMKDDFPPFYFGKSLDIEDG